MGNRISTTPEPTIMTVDFVEENAIQKLVHTQDLNIFELKKLVKIDGLEFDVIFSLDFENQNLVNIDELWRFKHLTKLKLPNNYLEKIEGLECLVNLQRLDLSFNFIKHICNLENLINLVDLNLTSNEIAILENLDTLKKLETLLIRRNHLKSFDNIHYLKQFNNLSSLAIGKNPLMLEKDANLTIIAALPKLKYLDFKIVTSDQVKEAIDKYPEETNKSVCTEEAINKKSKCPFPYSDKEAHVEALANGQGFKSLVSSDKNYQLLHSFPLASDISGAHYLKVTEIFDAWHETGHKYYQQMQHDKSQFLMMVSKAKQFSLEVAREEELKFTNFKEKIPKKLCSFYQHIGPADEKEKKIADFKKTFEHCLQNTLKNFMNANCLCVDLISNVCNAYEKEILQLNAKYILEVEKFCENLMAINKIFAKKFEKFYFGIQSSEFDLSNELDPENEETTYSVEFLQLIQNKELISMTLELSLRMHSTMLKERIKNLKMTLHDDVEKTVGQIYQETFFRQSEQIRNAVIFCNKQKCFLEKLLLKNKILKHYLGYR